MALSAMQVGVRMVRLGLNAENVWQRCVQVGRGARSPQGFTVFFTEIILANMDICSIVSEALSYLSPMGSAGRVEGSLGAGTFRAASLYGKVVKLILKRDKQALVELVTECLAAVRLYHATKEAALSLKPGLSAKERAVTDLVLRDLKICSKDVPTELSKAQLTQSEIEKFELALSWIEREIHHQSAVRTPVPAALATAAVAAVDSDDPAGYLTRNVIPRLIEDDPTFTEDFPDPRTGQDIRLFCPITQCAIRHPVTDHHGHVYERDAILEHLNHSDRCPLTRQRLTRADITDRPDLQRIVDNRLDHYNQLVVQAIVNEMRARQRAGGPV